MDEAHRGSARDDSNWREILEYFTGAVQLGMTATPLRQDNRDTYLYFGNPVYPYTLKQGMETPLEQTYTAQAMNSALALLQVFCVSRCASRGLSRGLPDNAEPDEDP